MTETKIFLFDMNQEQQRIKIAEACGWKEIQNGDAWGTPIGIPLTMPKKDNWRNMDGFFELPDYLSDLNAMHEAERVLTYEQFDDYYIELAKRMVRPFHATAAQRAEAFLRTLNLWEE
jgi:hypothetical protein